MDGIVLSFVPLYVFYVMAIGIVMFLKRRRALLAGEIHIKYFIDYQGKTERSLMVFKNHYDNQFQVPMLFLFACVAAVALRTVTEMTAILAASFFVSRLFHSYFHLGQKDIRLRAGSFFLGVILVALMWVEILLRF